MSAAVSAPSVWRAAPAAWEASGACSIAVRVSPGPTTPATSRTAAVTAPPRTADTSGVARKFRTPAGWSRSLNAGSVVQVALRRRAGELAARRLDVVGAHQRRPDEDG